MDAEYRQGEHICSLYETEEEQLAVAADYLADGLRAGERVFYVAESQEAIQRFRDALKAVGIDAAARAQRGALVESTHAEAHLANGSFDSERMLGLLNEALENALNDGFSGLRTCGDMSWLLLEPPGAEQVVEYEAHLNRFFHGVRGAGMCQYDRGRLPEHLIDHALTTHPSVIVDARHKPNPFYRSPELAVGRAANPDGVRFKLGELRQA